MRVRGGDHVSCVRGGDEEVVEGGVKGGSGKEQEEA